ncbi:MAG: 4Fe-4S cluster-binding domain-containing protein [Oscillospiraceae bacterium]
MRICDCGAENCCGAGMRFLRGDISDIIPTARGNTLRACRLRWKLGARADFHGDHSRQGAELAEHFATKPFVSRVHAKLSISGGRVFIEDMGATNHTYVNGELVTGKPRSFLTETLSGWAAVLRTMRHSSARRTLPCAYADDVRSEDPYPVKTLGPGDRVGIWLCGCSHGCPGCSNPELWSCGEQFRITRERLLQLVGSIAQGAEVDGFTITGGDPLEQSEELALLLPELRKISGDILVYTGYTLEQLRAMDSPAVESVLRNTSVLIDGEYIQRRNTGLPLRGSDNQRIIYLDDSLRARYEEYISGGSGIQDFPAADGVVSVGIHRPDYPQEFERRLAEKSIIKCDTEENGNDGA